MSKEIFDKYTRKFSSDDETHLLASISDTLSNSSDLRDSISRTLHLLSQHMGLNRGTITLIDPKTREISIQIAEGLSPEEQARGRYRLGEGITGQVIQSGEAAVVESIQSDPRFLNRTGSRTDVDQSFICLPLAIGSEIFGAISVDREKTEISILEADVKLLSFVALMIAQEVKFLRTLDEKNESLRNENLRLHEELCQKYNIRNIVGNSAVMHQVYENIKQVAQSTTTVLIRGESGTGKELVAQSIHYNSARANQPFIRLNCGAIPESLIETELFGHERGAFTDAKETKLGKFEIADGGTLFLDEIGELSPAVQVKLLRVLQEKEFERVGGNQTIKVNVRVVAATNRNLEEELKNKRFREDLYYRLNVFPIFLPPLRDRKSDILLLAEHFLEKYALENAKVIRRISSLAIDLLSSYHWPGNVRELENCIERSVLLCNGDTIQANHLPPTLQRVDTVETQDETLSFENLVSNFERELIVDALKKTKGNKSKAAKYLKVTERILGYKAELLGISYRVYRDSQPNH